MDNLENKSTNEIAQYVLALKQKHEKIKQEMIISFDSMEKIEKEFLIANIILNKRINGE